MDAGMEHSGLSPQAYARLGVNPEELKANASSEVDKTQKAESLALVAVKATASSIGAVVTPIFKGIATAAILLTLGLAASGTNLIMWVKNPGKELYTTTLLRQAYLPSSTLKVPLTAEKDLSAILKAQGGQGKRLHLQTDRGASIDGKLCAPNPNKANGKTVVLFNGNNGLYEESNRTISQYLKMGYQVCIFNYGGVGKGEGSSPGSAQELIGDGEVVIDHLMNEEGIKSKDLLLHGHSMGGAVACALGAKHPEANLRVDRSYSKYSDAAYDVLSAENNMSPLASVVTTIISKLTYLPSIVSHLVRNSRFEINSVGNLQTRLEAQDSLNITSLTHVVSAGEDEVLTERSPLLNHMDEMAYQERIMRSHISHINHTQELDSATLQIGKPETQADTEKEVDGRELTLERLVKYQVDLPHPDLSERGSEGAG